MLNISQDFDENTDVGRFSLDMSNTRKRCSRLYIAVSLTIIQTITLLAIKCATRAFWLYDYTVVLTPGMNFFK